MDKRAGGAQEQNHQGRHGETVLRHHARAVEDAQAHQGTLRIERATYDLQISDKGLLKSLKMWAILSPINGIRKFVLV